MCLFTVHCLPGIAIWWALLEKTRKYGFQHTRTHSPNACVFICAHIQIIHTPAYTHSHHSHYPHPQPSRKEDSPITRLFYLLLLLLSKVIDVSLAVKITNLFIQAKINKSHKMFIYLTSYTGLFLVY